MRISYMYTKLINYWNVKIIVHMFIYVAIPHAHAIKSIAKI